MTQSELGKSIGVSFSSINRYENGKHFPTPIVLNAIQTYFRSRGIDFTYDVNEWWAVRALRWKMGFFDFLKPQTPSITTTLPDAAKQQINSGRLPNLTSNRIFLKNGETCHFIDKSVYEKRIVQKHRIRRSSGYSTPGFTGGSRIRTDGSNTKVVDEVKHETCKGVLYITNQRVIFVGSQADFGFDIELKEIVAIVPYSNCIELQLADETLKLFVPDGNLPLRVLNLLM